MADSKENRDLELAGDRMKSHPWYLTFIHSSCKVIIAGIICDMEFFQSFFLEISERTSLLKFETIKPNVCIYLYQTQAYCCPEQKIHCQTIHQAQFIWCII